MSHLLTDETALYTTMWAAVPSYSDVSPGERLLPLFLDCIAADQTRLRLGDPTVLDAGCGSGKGSLALQQAGFRVTACDLTGTGLSDDFHRAGIRYIDGVTLWNDLRPLAPLWKSFDWVYCTDVLEHLPTQFTLLTVHRLLEAARRGVFLSVGLEQDSFGAWVGKPLHQTVQSFTWWRDSLREISEVVEARDLHQGAVFYLKARV